MGWAAYLGTHLLSLSLSTVGGGGRRQVVDGGSLMVIGGSGC